MPRQPSTTAQPNRSSATAAAATTPTSSPSPARTTRAEPAAGPSAARSAPSRTGARSWSPAFVTPPPRTTSSGLNASRMVATAAARILVVSSHTSTARGSRASAARPTSRAVTTGNRARLDPSPPGALSASRARSTMFDPDAYASRQPLRPHRHGRPSMSISRWPSSPAFPATPRYGRPSSTRPPPMPVEMVRYTRLRTDAPLPAPKRHSATAAAVASLSTAAGTPKASSTIATSGTLSHPGKWSGDRMIPRSGSSGPPHAIPTALTARVPTPAASIARRPRSRWRRIMSSGPASRSDGSTSRECTSPPPPTTPAAIFVPPTSSARTRSVAPRASSRRARIRAAVTPATVRRRGGWLAGLRAASPLGTGRRDALEEVPLAEEEHDDHRERHDDACGHHQLELALAARDRVEPIDQGLQAERQRVERDVTHEDQRLDEVGPAGLQLEDEHDDQCRARERHGDAPEHPGIARAVDSRRLEQLAWQAEEELAQQEDVEGRAEQVARPQGREQRRVHLAERVPDQEVGDHQHGAGEHHAGEHEPEQQVPEREPEVREPERHDAGADRDRHGGEDAHDHAVREPARDRRDREDVAVVAELQRPDEELVREDVRSRLERRAQEPDEGEHEQDRGEEQSGKVQDLRDDPAGRPAFVGRGPRDARRRRGGGHRAGGRRAADPALLDRHRLSPA